MGGQSGDLGQVRMIPGTLGLIAPQDHLVLNQKKAGHGPHIAHALALAMTLAQGHCPAAQSAQPEHFGKSALGHLKGCVKKVVGIGDRTSLRPPLLKEVCPFGHRALVDKQNGRKAGLFQGGRAQSINKLAAKDSAKVAQKDQKGGLIRGQLVGKRARTQILPLNGGV